MSPNPRKKPGRGLGAVDEPAVDVDEVEPGSDPALRALRKQLLSDTLRPYRGRLAVGAVAVVGSTLAVLSVPVLVKLGIDHGVTPRHSGTLMKCVAVLLVAIAVDFGCQRIAQRIAGEVAERSSYDLRMRLWRHMQGLSLDWFERQKSGRVISRATSDVEAVYELFSQAALTLVSNLMLFVGIGVLLVVLDPLLALVVMAVIPVLLLATWVFKRRSERAYRAVREKIALVIIHLAETLTGIRVVQAFTREPINQAQFDDINDQNLAANNQTVLLMSVYGPGIDFLGQLAIALVLVVGGLRVIDGATSVGTLTAFILYVRQFFDPLQELSQFYNSLQAANAGLEKIASVLATESSVPERAGADHLPPPEPGRGGAEIHLARVSFRYRAGELVLRDVELTIGAGETLALVGATGAGKSTIAKLVARFYDPSDGAVTLDGHDLRLLAPSSLRKAIAVVPQEAFLFAGTIHENVAMGRPDATRAEVEAAAWAVGAHAFVTALPDGYDTDVNTRGARLSGGQRQLISFARAWLVDPRVLILDEATSALDLPSERLIQRALRQLLVDRTAIVIAHRLSSIEMADRVAVVEGGRIVELGSQAELLSTDTRFAALHRRWEATLA
ncbi:MAG: transporter [Acidimicrobiales bacterium]|nr:transporter [Acidimicrobiales bacterium]